MPESIQVIDRMVAIIDVVSQAKKKLVLKQIALETDLPSSTVFRILSALKSHQIIKQNEDNTYQLGNRLLALSEMEAKNVDIVDVAKPIMRELSLYCGETVNLSKHEGIHMVYVERVLSTKMVRVCVEIGRRSPLHVLAVGKLVLADMDSKEFSAYVKSSQLKRMTVHTLCQSRKLRAESLAYQKKKIAYEIEEAEIGLGCIGSLIPSDKLDTTYGLSISAPKTRLKKQWEKALKQSVNDIAKALG